MSPSRRLLRAPDEDENVNDEAGVSPRWRLTESAPNHLRSLCVQVKTISLALETF